MSVSGLEKGLRSGQYQRRNLVKDTISIRARVLTVQMGSRIGTIHLFLQSFNPLWPGDRVMLLSRGNFQVGGKRRS